MLKSPFLLYFVASPFVGFYLYQQNQRKASGSRGVLEFLYDDTPFTFKLRPYNIVNEFGDCLNNRREEKSNDERVFYKPCADGRTTYWNRGKIFFSFQSDYVYINGNSNPKTRPAASNAGKFIFKYLDSFGLYYDGVPGKD